MEPPRYDVWLVRFAPDAMPTAAGGLQRAFGIDAASAERVLQELPFLAKRGAERAQAERYAAALASIGAEVRIKTTTHSAPARSARGSPLMLSGAPGPSAPSPPATARTSAPRPDSRMPTSAKLILGGIGLVSLLMVIAAITLVRFARKVAEDPAALLGQDTEEDPFRIEDALASSQEARDFLYCESCRLWAEDISRDALEAWIERLYAAGASQVLFAGIEQIGRLRVSALLVVELPAEGSRRARVFEIWNQGLPALAPPAADSGQGHVYLGLD